jgi:hypothetical protein
MEKRICKECILHSKVPGVVISEDGICNVCHAVKDNRLIEKDSAISQFYVNRMTNLFRKVKSENHMYDALVLVSGGKDCIRLMNLVKENYQLNILALSIVTPFVTENALKNIEESTSKLHIPLMKFFVDPEMFREVLRYAIVNGDNYDLGQNAACKLCYFFIYWCGIRLAIQMDIPIVLEGKDKSQKPNIYITGSKMKSEIEQERKPYGKIHDLFEDAVGDKYGKTIYHYDREQIIGRNYPTEVAPLSFMDFDYTELEREIEKSGLDMSKYRKAKTTCQAVHLFDFFSYLKYDCPTSIYQWAAGCRMDYPTLMQLNIAKPEEVKNPDRETLLIVMKEYKDVIFYIAEHCTDSGNYEQLKENLLQYCKVTKTLFSEEAMEMIGINFLEMGRLANYFDLDLKSFLAEYEKSEEYIG